MAKILTQNLFELTTEHLVERIAWTVLSKADLKLNLLNHLADCCTRIKLGGKGRVTSKISKLNFRRFKDDY